MCDIHKQANTPVDDHLTSSYRTIQFYGAVDIPTVMM